MYRPGIGCLTPEADSWNPELYEEPSPWSTGDCMMQKVIPYLTRFMSPLYSKTSIMYQ